MSVFFIVKPDNGSNNIVINISEVGTSQKQDNGLTFFQLKNQNTVIGEVLSVTQDEKEAAEAIVKSGVVSKSKAGKIIRIPVDSSNLKNVGYVPNNKTLEVEFRTGNGTFYRYHDVPANVFVNLMSADSKGKEFHKSIRNKFKFDKVVS